MTVKNKTLTFALAGVLSLGSFALTACGGSSSSASSSSSTEAKTEEVQVISNGQDNCYGEDLPEINTESSNK